MEIEEFGVAHVWFHAGLVRVLLLSFSRKANGRQIETHDSDTRARQLSSSTTARYQTRQGRGGTIRLTW